MNIKHVIDQWLASDFGERACQLVGVQVGDELGQNCNNTSYILKQFSGIDVQKNEFAQGYLNAILDICVGFDAALQERASVATLKMHARFLKWYRELGLLSQKPLTVAMLAEQLKQGRSLTANRISDMKFANLVEMFGEKEYYRITLLGIRVLKAVTAY
jgi:hypothetical protein